MIQLELFKNEFKKAWKVKGHLKIELVTLFLILPGFLQMIGISIFELEKACRVNLKIEKEVCDNLNNVPYKQICSLIELHSINFENLNATEILKEKLKFILSHEHSVTGVRELILIEKVCSAEKESQKLVSKLFAIRAPISTVFILVIVAFAGAWSDKHDVRKAFILVPFFGELLGVIIYVVSAKYMNEIPVEYPIIAGKMVSSIFGGQTLYMIGASSYLTVTTDEKYRTFRFGCFSMFITLLGIFGSPLSGIIYTNFTYVGMYVIFIYSNNKFDFSSFL